MPDNVSGRADPVLSRRDSQAARSLSCLEGILETEWPCTGLLRALFQSARTRLDGVVWRLAVAVVVLWVALLRTFLERHGFIERWHR